MIFLERKKGGVEPKKWGSAGATADGSYSYSRVRKVLVPSLVPRVIRNALLTLSLDYSV